MSKMKVYLKNALLQSVLQSVNPAGEIELQTALLYVSLFCYTIL